MKLLVISDTHITPDYNSVDDWQRLGEYVVRTKPDYIIHLGDVADMNSLAWLKAERGHHTTEEECEQVSQHLFAFEEVIRAEQAKNRRDHETIYNPTKFLCLGNHDVRQNSTHIQDIFEDCNWHVADYTQPVVIEGITFCHCMYKGLSSTPCTTAVELLQNWHGDVVVGHSHCQEYAESYSMATQSRIRAIKCPMFNSNDTSWNLQAFNKYARGFTEINTNPFQFIWRDMSCLLGNSSKD